MRSIDPYCRRVRPATFAVLVVAAGTYGAAACGSSSPGDRLDAGAPAADAAADMTPGADMTPAADAVADVTPAADVTTDTAENMIPDAAADTCVNSSPTGCPPLCTWAQGEQYVCAVRADAGAPGYRCYANSCAGGINLISCVLDDTVWDYYFDPSGALFAEMETEPGAVWRSGPCSFNAEALVCDGIVDAGCGGSPDSSAD